jgi:hypothetical protein
VLRVHQLRHDAVVAAAAVLPVTRRHAAATGAAAAAAAAVRLGVPLVRLRLDPLLGAGGGGAAGLCARALRRAVGGVFAIAVLLFLRALDGCVRAWAATSQR